jgi:hypothetical protein
MTQLDNQPIATRPVDTRFRTAPSFDERMLTLTYRTARQLGYSPGASHRLSRRLLLANGSTSPQGTARTARSRVTTAVHAMLARRVDHDRLREALRVAVLWDEVTLLPPRQRLLVSLALTQRCTVTQLVDQTGWTAVQVARMLRTGMRTITVCGAV